MSGSEQSCKYSILSRPQLSLWKQAAFSIHDWEKPAYYSTTYRKVWLSFSLSFFLSFFLRTPQLILMLVYSLELLYTKHSFSGEITMNFKRATNRNIYTQAESLRMPCLPRMNSHAQRGSFEFCPGKGKMTAHHHKAGSI